jgi:hypothetical protein
MRAPTGIAAGLAVIAAALAAGCGPTPPQAPLPDAQKLDTALSGIATACGLSYQSTALDPAARLHLAPLNAKATIQARKLATVYHGNPAWIYQGETVRSIVNQTLSTLQECGLHGAKLSLSQALAKGHS